MQKSVVFVHLLLSLVVPSHAGVKQEDFTGIGHIHVLNSSDWQTATPDLKVGCMDASGKFVKDVSEESCGVFARLAEYPYTLSTSEGNCTFEDDRQENNGDSLYGQMDYAWNCGKDYKTSIYDELYTITGLPYVFLCFGDIACFYDAKRVPAPAEQLSLWQFHWGSQQLGITPGHIQLLLMWDKIGDLPKREDSSSVIPGPRVELESGQQVPLLGKRVKALEV
ncbi:hypothetical protein LEMA_P101100.1 [Plenodomus lingam JN3]|uniref:Uncharacterized protein n=2 Tax=Leptosphaeria maculans TaxID=5022 RepID=E5A0B9_LEPMJ|nr:hypothetical protein LEMA_P101100.1 [Plenodomus lingam JN3]CBX96979.1 hypothetical protein LEMA_P101100.1 [Plenodomus lingam JN3]